MIRIQICKLLVNVKRATPTPSESRERSRQERKSWNNDAVKRVMESEGIRDFRIVLLAVLLMWSRCKNWILIPFYLFPTRSQFIQIYAFKKLVSSIRRVIVYKPFEKHARISGGELALCCCLLKSASNSERRWKAGNDFKADLIIFHAIAHFSFEFIYLFIFSWKIVTISLDYRVFLTLKGRGGECGYFVTYKFKMES